MATSPSSSDYSGTEDSVSESKSNQSLSVGHYPSEDRFFYEDTISSEEAPSMESSVCFLPPLQGAWGTESLRRLFRRQNRMPDYPEQFCKLSITLAWDVDVGPDRSDSLTSLDINGHSQWMDKWPKDRTKLTVCKVDNLVQKLETFLENTDDRHDTGELPESTQEKDFHLSSSSPPRVAQVRHEDHSTSQVSPKGKAAQNEDITEVVEDPPEPQEAELVQVNQVPRRQKRVSAGASSILQAQAEEDASNSFTTSCLNFRWVFHWLRERVFSRWRREYPNQATVGRQEKAERKIHSLRGNRVQPQE